MNNKNYEKHPKVLVISHNVFSKTSSMGKTLYSLFSEWPREAIAQLYLHSEVPTMDFCENYFRITDFEVLKSLYSKKTPGMNFGEKDIDKSLVSSRVDKNIQANIYQFGRKRKPYMYVGRNLLWNLKTWKTKKLEKWISEFNPDVIFFAAGDYVFSYNITMEIAKKYNLPVITYICDDFYINSKKTFSILHNINNVQFKKAFNNLIRYSSKQIYICDAMKNDYSKLLNKEGTVLMTPSSLKSKSDIEINDTMRISYIGTLGLNRWIPLIEIGRELRYISDGKIFIDVYSDETSQNITQYLIEENGIKFNGNINSEKVQEVIGNSDILIHVEAMDEKMKNRTKYSISTKIADSLSSGSCMLCYGPEDIASISYLRDNDAACVITNQKDISKKLSRLLKDKELRKYYGKNALNTAEIYHSKEKNSRVLFDLIDEAVEGWK